MKSQFVIVFLITTSLFTLQSCGGKAKEAEKKNAITIETDHEGEKSKITIESNNLGASTEEAFKQLSNGEFKSGEVVPYQSLKELLPNTLSGMNRTKIEGQKSGMQGMNISTASAEYESGDKHIQVSIMDAGGSALTLAGVAMWANMEFERESDDSYERTTTIDGNKAFEQFDKNAKTGQVSVLVDNHFIVNIEGTNISEKDLRNVLSDMNLRKLGKLK